MWEISDKRLQRYMKTHSKIFDNYNKKWYNEYTINDCWGGQRHPHT
jgi:hypothetical protein